MARLQEARNQSSADVSGGPGDQNIHREIVAQEKRRRTRLHEVELFFKEEGRFGWLAVGRVIPPRNPGALPNPLQPV
jgi:hypothetical protein